MKAIPVLILFLIAASPSLSQLTRNDVEQVLYQALEPIGREIAAIKLDIAEVKGEIKAVRAEAASKDDIVATRDEIAKARDEVSSLYRWFILAWITIILAIFAIPFLRIGLL
ncbi:hypothetical protein DRP77_10045 [Candidatus Poribacteria bacterium]|nr:MAG: hypothetical protein DRP77_10045 [Candidatus Poribacteria bacterium]